MKPECPILSASCFLPQKFVPASNCLLPSEQSLQLPGPAVGTRSRKTPRARAIQHYSYSRRVFGLGNFLAHPGKPARRCHANRQVENALGEFDESPHVRATASENQPGGNLRIES